MKHGFIQKIEEVIEEEMVSVEGFAVALALARVEHVEKRYTNTQGLQVRLMTVHQLLPFIVAACNIQ